MDTASISGSLRGLPAHAGNLARQRSLRFGLKLAVGLGLVVWLAARADWRKLLACISHVSPGWLALAVGTYLVGQTICAWKWSLLARSLGFERPLRFYWVNYLGAMFPSLFLPTSVGGDVFRAVALAARGGDRAGATVSVLADRGTGVLAMLWIAALACLAGPTRWLPGYGRWGIYALCAALTLGFALPFFGRPRFAKGGFLARVVACWDRPGLLLASLGAAAAFQLLAIVVYVLLGRALGLPVAPGFYFVLCPLVSLAAMAPCTINGMGVREAMLVSFFPAVAVGAEQAVVFGLAWTTLVTAASLCGGLVLLFADPAPSEHAAGSREAIGQLVS